MDNPAVKEALTDILKEDSTILQDWRKLTDELDKRVPSEALYNNFFKNVLSRTNIGMTLGSAAEDRMARDQAEQEALEKARKITKKDVAEFVVHTLTTALGWKDDFLPPIEKNAEDFYNDGIKAMDEGKHSEAMAAFNRAIEMLPSYADAYRMRGELYAQNRQYALAIADYDKIIEQDSDDISAYRNRGVCYYESGNFDAALIDFDKVLKATSNDQKIIDMRQKILGKGSKTIEKTAEDFYNDGLKAINEEKHLEAMYAFNRAIEMSPTYTNAYNMRGTLYAKNGQYALAISDYSKIIEYNPNNVSAYRNRGICYYEIGNFDAALTDFDKVLQTNHDDQKIIDMRQKIIDQIEPPGPVKGLKDKFFSMQGRLNRKRYFWRGLIIGVIQAIVLGLNSSFLPLGNNEAITVYLLLFLLFVASMVSHITLIVRRAHDVDRKGLWAISFSFQYIYSLSGAIFWLAVLLEWWTLLEYVMLFYNDLSWITIFSAPVALYLLFKKGTPGTNRFGADPLSGSTDESFGIKEKIITSFFAGIVAVFLCMFFYEQHNHELAREHYEQGLSYSKEEAYDKALVEFDKAIELDSQYAEAYYNRGLLYAEDSEYEKAFSDFNDAIKNNSNYAEAYYNRGVIYYEEKDDDDKALADFDRAISLNNEYEDAFYNRGVVYYKGKKDYDKAISDFDRTIELNSKYVMAYYFRGQLYREKAENEKALTDFNEALKINHRLYFVYNERGLVYQEMKKYDNAIEDYTKAISLYSKDGKVYKNRADSYYQKKQFDKALADYTQAIESNYRDVDTYIGRGRTHHALKQYDSSIADYTQAISIKSNYAWAYLLRGIAYDDNGDYDRAIADDNKVLEIEPNNSAAYNNRGVAYGHKGNYDRAIADYKKAVEINPNEDLYKNNLKNAQSSAGK